jgi:hypothetical protein
VCSSGVCIECGQANTQGLTCTDGQACDQVNSACGF